MSQVTFIGYGGLINAQRLHVVVLGNHLPKDNPGFNNCMVVNYPDYKEAWKHYCKNLKITVDKDKLTDSEIVRNFKEVISSDCIIEEITDEEVDIAIKEHKELYEG